VISARNVAWLTAGAVLTIASAGVYIELAGGSQLPSVIRNPLANFAQPGMTVWWFALGGPFQTGPLTPRGIVFASLANGLFWLLLVRSIAFVYRKFVRNNRK
jgi:hypothetical protein